jgi:4-hydroxy-tetrahydrodipicolinate synthase
VLTPAEVVAIYNAVPAVAAMKEGNLEPWRSRQIHAGAPDLFLWECNEMALTAGWAARGVTCKAALGTTGYFFDYPGNLRGTKYHELLWEGRIDEALAYADATAKFDAARGAIGKWLTSTPQRPGYFTHWGEPPKYAASLMGLPVGSYPHSRPPQGILPEHAKEEIRTALERAGLIGVARRTDPETKAA